MAAPQVVSSTPVNGATTVSVKDALSVVFNTALLPSSITSATVVLMNDDSVESVPGTLSLSADRKTVVFTPSKGLLEETNYVFTAVGADLGLAGGNIKAADSTDLANSYSIAFRTTVDAFARISEAAPPDAIERYGPIREDAIAEVLTGYLELLETTPAGFQTGVSRSLSEIELVFDSAVSATGSHPALELTLRNVLGLDEYYGESDGTGRFLLDWLDENDTARRALFAVEPSGTLVYSGSTLKWVKAQGSPNFHYNTEVICRVRADSIVNGTGLMLEEDVYITFTTEYFPFYVGVEHIRLLLGRSVSEMYDDSIARHIWAASIDAVEQAAGCFDLDYPYPAVRRYVRAKTVLDILDEIGLLADLQSGGKKQLGDFIVQTSAVDLAKVVGAYKRAEKDLKDTLFELRYYRGQRSPKYVVKGQDSAFERSDFRLRTWQHLRGTGRPAANTFDTRRAKSWLATDHGNMVGGQIVRVKGYDADADETTTGYYYPWWLGD